MHPSDKIVATLAQAASICRERQKEGQKVVLTTGCYDLLHGGHLEYIWDAGQRGWLMVGVNSDNFVRRSKGACRPIRGQEDRALMIAGLFPVQLVTIFDCDYELISTIKPDVYVASATYRVRVRDDRRRMEILKSIGAEIVELGEWDVDSTTAIIERIKTAYGVQSA